MRTSSEKWHIKCVEKDLGLEEGTIETKKEFVHLQGHESKVLVIYIITIESERMYTKLMEMKLWNGTHAKYVSLKKKIVR